MSHSLVAADLVSLRFPFYEEIIIHLLGQAPDEWLASPDALYEVSVATETC
jgi:hypothetical protein